MVAGRGAFALGGAGRDGLAEPGDLRIFEGDIGGLGVLFQMAAPHGAGDGDDEIVLGQHPGEGELRGRSALVRGHLLKVL